MKITREDVLRVAQLAHLELSDNEVEMYRGQLDAILSYVGKLNEVDVSGVEPMAQVLAGATRGGASDGSNDAEERENSALREDLERPMHTAEAVLKIAPDPSAPYFRVPKVIER
ncbi:MAG: Asp-tRNA(Asn)/Glu-tRNA(Gln) amidotransferase subunit GatC [Candidatus Acidiferrales bacterium]